MLIAAQAPPTWPSKKGKIPVVTLSTSLLPPNVQDYLETHTREPAALAALREATHLLPEGYYQTGPEQGRFITLLVECIGAHRALDIGTFTGLSAVAIALGMPVDGRVLTLDISEEFASHGRPYWTAAGVADRIELLIGPALAGLQARIGAGEAGTYDFAFIDADKEAYADYLERCLELVRPGGLIAIDNTLWRGRVADMGNTKPKTLAMRALNDAIFADERISPAMLPIGDGMTLIRRR